MLFCQFAEPVGPRHQQRASVGDRNLNHLGVPRHRRSRSVTRQSRLAHLQDYYFHLLDLLGQQKTHRKIKFRIKSKILLLDSTTISCLDLFDWAHYKRQGRGQAAHCSMGGLPVERHNGQNRR
ncbi:MAG: hypothetical protein IPN69_16165 [Acidobacteria bacterium]|nr:hypothetical protein [Acidobacteriota bacterium]